MSEQAKKQLTVEDVKVLNQPFEKDRLGVKVQSFSKDRTKAMLVLYLQHTDVMDQLEKVDPSWSTEVVNEEGRGDSVFVRMKMTVKGVTRENVGEGGDPKSGYSDALKRCAMLFGVGRYLYDSPTVWVDYNDQRDKFKQWTVEEYDRAAQRSRYQRPEPPKEESVQGKSPEGPRPGPAAQPAPASGSATAASSPPQPSTSSPAPSGGGDSPVGKSPPSSPKSSGSPSTPRGSAGSAPGAAAGNAPPSPKPTSTKPASSAAKATSSAASPGRASGSGHQPRSRDELNRRLMNVYRPYLTLYPETRFVDLLQERYKVGETRLMTVEQLEEFLTWMEAGVAQGKSLAKPGAGSSSGSGPAGGPGPDKIGRAHV